VSKKKKAEAPAEPVAPTGPTGRSLGALVVLGALSALWALFLWAELVVARSGGTAFCAVSEGIDCTALWDGDFASSVHKLTRLPVAGWGLLWGGLATAFPLIALITKSEGSPSIPAVTATRLIGAAGAVSTLGLAGISIASGTLCIGCLGTYVLVVLYAVVSLWAWRDQGFPEASRAITQAFLGFVVGFAVLIYPGIQTPTNAAKAGDAAIAAASKTPPKPANGTATPPKPANKEPPAFATGPGTGDPETDQQVEAFVLSLPPQLQQMLSDALHMYNDSATFETEPPRALHGSADAPLKIVDWTDPLCGHCAQLFDTIKQIEAAVPPGSFSVESRYYPLDGNCNPQVPRKSEDGLRCTIVGAQICMEGREGADSFTKMVFDNQRSMNGEMLEGIAKRYIPLEELKACIESDATAKKLESDLKYASKLNPDGTPIVMVNGKKAPGFGPFLYAMILTKGVGQHPGFKHLPKPNKDAHMH
jgi:serine/threonine-protein kinase